MREKLICDDCGMEFINPNSSRTRKFCSRKCCDRWRSKKFSGNGNPFYNKKHNSIIKEKISKLKKGKRVSISTEFKKGGKCIFAGKTKRNYLPLMKSSKKLKGRTFSLEHKNKLSKVRKRLFMENKLHLPLKDTSIEVKIQNFLKQLGIEFFTHQYMKIEHGYQCDILIPSINLVIECDGDYWHKYPVGNEIDHIRTKELLEKGFKVLRLWEFEIKEMDLNKLIEKIKK